MPEPALRHEEPHLAAGEVAARLVQRLCHDLMSPASGVVSGLDLLEDPAAADLHDEAMQLITSSARSLVDTLTYARAAFGVAANSCSTQELEALVRGLFARARPELEWRVAPETLDGTAARVLLNLAQLAAAAVAIGGLARLSVRCEPPWTAVTAEALGPKARLHAEVAAGLRGEPLGEGLSGRWVQAWCLHDLVTAAGGMLGAEAVEGEVVFRAVVPA